MKQAPFSRLLLALGLAWLLTNSARAHTSSTAWLQLVVSNRIAGAQLELPLRDLDEALGLDANDDGQLTWGELRRRETDLQALVQRGLPLRCGDAVPVWKLAGLQVSERSEVPCAVLRLSAQLPDEPTDLALDYHLFFDQDPLHRCLVGGAVTTVLSPEHRRFEVPSPGENGSAPIATGWTAFVREGVHHIWTGYDHLAFLLVLLLPAVLRRTPHGWLGAANFREAFFAVIKVVTAFTLAHSVTLALAAFETVRLPARLVEATIAASILVAAGLAWRKTQDGRIGGRQAWLTAFGFGLIHGFGFAGVLGELGLGSVGLAGPLLSFNLGVELGQLACVAVFLPVAFALRDTRFYRHGVWPLGTALVTLVAGGWFVERAFAVTFMPF